MTGLDLLLFRWFLALARSEEEILITQGKIRRRGNIICRKIRGRRCVVRME